jgi:zinc and cadmium transporter
MTETIIYSLIAIFAVSSISLIGLFFVPARIAQMRTLLLAFVGVAIGALLGDSFIHLIPEAMVEIGSSATALWILAGMGMFFILEKFLHWHHHHNPHTGERADCADCEVRVAPFGTLIIASDMMHNVIDGAIIAAGFFISVEVGIATTVAVALHEIPQEIGDFGVLLHAGFSRLKALLVNFASALTAFIGAFIVFIIGTSFENVIPIFSALTAGAFIYIAGSDLVPELHKSPRFKESVVQILAIILGILAMVTLTFLE